MAIIHETKYQKEDGTEVEIIPLKDIVVTAPGYSIYGGLHWTREWSLSSRQESQLQEALREVYPKEADYYETIDSYNSPEGGRARFRTYIEKSKIPQLKESIRQSMTYGKLKEILFGKRKVYGPHNKRLREPEIDMLEKRGYVIAGNLPKLPEVSGGTVYFNLPDEKNSPLEVKFLLDTDRKAILLRIREYEIESILRNLEDGGGLSDRIRAELIRELIQTQREK